MFADMTMAVKPETQVVQLCCRGLGRLSWRFAVRNFVLKLDAGENTVTRLADADPSTNFAIPATAFAILRTLKEQGVGGIAEVLPAAEVVERSKQEHAAACRRLAARCGTERGGEA
jgi:hypothetical protein